MENKGEKRIPLACRYIPYDQWFLTHVDPSWKIKHLKQLILSRCFNLSFDRRFLGNPAEHAEDSRLPSPITFAPDAGNRPVSPIKFATPQELKKKKSTAVNVDKDDEGSVSHDDASDVGHLEQGKDTGYEEDDEYDEENEDEDYEDVPSPIFPGGKVGGASGLAGPSGRIGAFSTHPKPSQPDTDLMEDEPSSTRKRKGRFNPLSKLGKSKDKLSAEDKPQEEDGIQTAWFTLLRFTTGQVLEEDYALSWYNFMPHELVELHNSVPPVNFSIATAFHQLLLPSTQWNKSEGTRMQHMHSYSRGGGLVKSGLITASADATAVLTTAYLMPSSLTSATAPPLPVVTQALDPHAQLQLYVRVQHSQLMNKLPTLTALPRSDPDAYVQPYWEGWVRALRTVWRPEAAPMREAMGPGGKGRFEYPEYSGGMIGAGGVGFVGWETAFGAIEGGIGGSERVKLKLADGKDKGKSKESYWEGDAGGKHAPYDKERHTEYDVRSRQKTKLEWRERWVVIKDGVVYMYKKREDTVPSHRTPLAALVNLRGADHLATSIHSRPSRRTRSIERVRDRSSAHHQDHSQRRSASHPRSSTSNARDAPNAKNTLSPQHSSGALYHKTSMHDTLGSNLHRTGHSSPSASPSQRSQRSRNYHYNQSKHIQPVSEVGHRTIVEREARREHDKQKEMERRKAKEKHEKEIENLKRWDDLGITFSFSGKSKDKGKGKEKVKDDKRRVGMDMWPREVEREEDLEGHMEKEKEGRERERERRRNADNQKAVQAQPALRNPLSYVPTSRDEAEAAGMKIICAKFQYSRAREREQEEREKKALNDSSIPTRRYTSTAPSLAGNAVPPNNPHVEEAHHDSSGGMSRDKRATESAHGHGHSQSLVPRKTSLPILPGLGQFANNSGSATAMVSATPLVATGSNFSRPESSSTSSNKFGISGLFGKDKESEKEDRKREDREKKAREKEHKSIQKEWKKGRWRDDDDDDPGAASSTSLRIGLARKDKAAADASLTSPSENSHSHPLPQRSVASLSTADSSTIVDHGHSANSGSPAIDKIKLTISPITSPKGPLAQPEANVQNDSDSSMSMSSPIFAQIGLDGSEGEDDVVTIQGQSRRGYRYGGYRVPPKHHDSDTMASVDAGLQHSRSEAKSGIPNAAEARPETTSARTDIANSLHPHPHNKYKEKGDDRGEWIVFDMGSDQAFHSILRVLHRHFSNPLNSDFLSGTIPSSTFDVSPLPVILPNFVKDDGENASVLNESISRTSSSSQDGQSYNTGSNTSVGSETDPSMTVSVQTSDLQVQRSSRRPRLTIQPPSSQTSMAPALPYPEWRTETVHRARSYGLREAGRPTELSLYGWGRYSLDMRTSAAYARLRKKEEAIWQQIRENITALNANAEGLSIVPSWDNDDGGQRGDEDLTQSSDSGVGEKERTSHISEVYVSRRRMSTVSHVSTIKASAARSEASSSSGDSAPSVVDQGTPNRGEGASVDTDAKERYRVNDSDDIPRLTEEFGRSYVYGRDDEDIALVEGFGSMVDSDEESEVEWLAWTTDLTRQHSVRQQRLAAELHENQSPQEEEDLSDSDSQALSPMEFSDPFVSNSSMFISKDILLPTVLPPIPPPKSPEEERRQYAEKLRKLEPSATSTSIPPSPTPALSLSPRVSSLNALATHQPTPVPNIHGTLAMRSQGSQSWYNTQRYNAPLSSPSSSESLGRAQQPFSHLGTSTFPINTALANASPRNQRNHSNPMSPLGGEFSPINRELNSLSQSPTLSPSAGHSYGPPGHQRMHSRSFSNAYSDEEDIYSLSSLGPGRSTLHHSISMPLSHSTSDPDRGSLSAHSPTRRSAEKTLTQPISMPILSNAQILQIESETEARLEQEARYQRSESNITCLTPSPSTSPPSSYAYSSAREPSTSYGSMPRRSSSSGMIPASPSSSPSGGTVARFTSARQKPLPMHPNDRQPEDKQLDRRVLRKKRSDLSRNAAESGRDSEPSSPVSKQRPPLSFLNLSSNGSKMHIPLHEAQPPVQQRHPHGPRSAHPDHNANASSSSNSSSTYQNAKALLRRVRSGSSLKVDMHIEQVTALAESGQSTWPAYTPPSGVITTSESSNQGMTSSPSRPRHVSSPVKKKFGTVDRIVQSLDSSLDFFEGR